MCDVRLSACVCVHISSQVIIQLTANMVCILLGRKGNAALSLRGFPVSKLLVSIACCTWS